MKIQMTRLVMQRAVTRVRLPNTTKTISSKQSSDGDWLSIAVENVVTILQASGDDNAVQRLEQNDDLVSRRTSLPNLLHAA